VKKYSEDKFVLRCPLTPFEIFERLNGRTLEKKTLAMVWTDKDFIGKINKASFEVIDSSYPIPYGAACILKGTINPNSTINLVTSLHRSFRILFLVWIPGYGGVVSCFLDSRFDSNGRAPGNNYFNANRSDFISSISAWNVCSRKE
jgi:hypothetical protein